MTGNQIFYSLIAMYTRLYYFEHTTYKIQCERNCLRKYCPRKCPALLHSNHTLTFALIYQANTVTRIRANIFLFDYPVQLVYIWLPFTKFAENICC